MKGEFGLIKKSHGYSIHSIQDQVVQFVVQILAGKIMRKCHVDKVLVHVVSLAAQCTKGVQYNLAQYLCKEFLVNCHKAQENSKPFHYAQLLLLILLIAWHLPEGSQFPPQEENLPKATKFTSLWSTKDLERIKESKIFWILVEMDLRTIISQRPRLSPTLFEQLRAFTESKSDLHNVSIRVRRNPNHIWHKMPYLVLETYV